MASAQPTFASTKTHHAKGYYLRTFEDVFTRYLPHSGIQSVQARTNPGKQGESEVFAKPDEPYLPDYAKMPETPAKPGFVRPCTDEKGGVRANARTRPSARPQIHSTPDVIVASARGAGGVVFYLSPDADLFTIEWRGPYDRLIDEAIRDNYEDILAWLIVEAEGGS